LWAAAAFAAQAGPVEFGMKEIENAAAERGLRPGAIRFTTEITSDAAETYRIQPRLIQGGDLRGLMYGLLAAAEQIRSSGRLMQEKGVPSTPMRGIRWVVETRDVEKEWFQSEDLWRASIRMLARNRINRFHLAFAQATRSARSLAMLRFISSTCAEHAIDFTLGVRAPAEGLKHVLAECPAIRSVQIRTDPGRAAGAQGKQVFAVVADAGRRVTLEVDGEACEAALASGAPVRIPVDYWSALPGHVQAAGRRAKGGLDLLERPRRHRVFWEVRGPAADSEFVWGDPAYVRSIVPMLTISETDGFEIDLPAGRTGPGAWFSTLVWGRLGYDPKTPDKVWLAGFQRRFGAAAADALEAYRQASRVCLSSRTSAGRTPAENAARLGGMAGAIERALVRARSKIDVRNGEWRATEAGLRSLAQLARRQARRVAAADHLAYFDETGDSAALEAARRELKAAFDVGGERDDIRRELEQIEERERIHARFGRFDSGFDFGSAVQQSAVAPRFHGVAPGTRYLETRGFGWVGDGVREAHRIEKQTASDALFGDSIRGQGRQVFRVKTGAGDFTVLLLGPGGAVDTRKLRARNGLVDVVFGEDAWEASGVILKSPRSAAPLPLRAWPKPLPRPAISHTPPRSVVAGRPLTLAVRVSPVANVASIRLHYGPMSLREQFKTIEHPPAKTSFTIPSADVSARWDLLYYFEVLNKEKTAWLDPDPDLAAPYYAVKVDRRK
jgi:hypothetical protein